MYALARNALFLLDAEQAHDLTLKSLRRMPALAGLFCPEVASDPVELLGLHFANRVGLAAGLDKNGDCIEAFGRMGFGFIEVGTVTPRPQPGNPKPRMFRLPEHRAIINRLGFNNKGVDHLVKRLRERRYHGVLGVNIGKNADTPIERAEEDYLHCLRAVHEYADYITVNISSPNTRNLRDLQDEDRLQALLAAIADERARLADAQGRRVPLLVKIAPDVSLAQLEAVARLARSNGVDGLIATNTTIRRDGVETSALANEAGGLSGAPLRALADEVLRSLRSLVGDDYPLVGVGGITDGQHAADKRTAGADLVQIYSGFIYGGPPLIAQCSKAMLPADAGIR